jgi:hypothetical protein
VPSACSPTTRSPIRCRRTTNSSRTGAKLREWLPKLVNVQHAVRFDLADGSHVDAVPQDEERLSRDDVTATVHYLKFPFTPAQQDTFGAGPARIVIDHPDYHVVAELTDKQRAELSRDFAE